MTINPNLKQHDAYRILDFNDLVQVLLYGGGAGGGKSWLGCEWLTKQSLVYPESRWFVGRETLTDIISSTYVTFNKVWKEDKVPSDLWTFNGKYNYIQWSNGSRIDFLDLRYLPSDPLYERYGSLEYTGGWIEEAGQINFGAFDVLRTRIGRWMNDHYNLKSKMLITANPKKNWLYPMFYKAAKDGTLAQDLAFIKALVGDNPKIDQGYIKNLNAIKNPALKARLRDGNWEYDDDPSTLLSFDIISDLFTNKGTAGDKYIIGDVARKGSDRMVVTYWEGLQLKLIIILPYEVKSDTTKAAEMIQKLADEKQVRKSNILLDEDGVGGGCVDILKCRGFINNSSPIQPPEVEWDKSKTLNFANLKTQCAFKLVELAESGAIGINEVRPDIKDLIVEELEQIKQKDIDKDGKVALVPKDVIKGNIGRSPDFADTIVMRMFYEIFKEKEPRMRFL